MLYLPNRFAADLRLSRNACVARLEFVSPSFTAITINVYLGAEVC